MITNYDIIIAFSDKPILTRRELKDYFKANNPALKDSSLDWLVHNLNQKRIVQRVGYNRYRAGTEDALSKVYKANLSETAGTILASLEEAFPLLSFIVWETLAFNEFANHQMAYNYIVVEVEKPLDESVFHALRQQSKHAVLYRPDEKELALYAGDITIVVLPLTSEAPIDGHYARLEKLLVDLFANKLLDGLVSRGDYPGIFEEAFSRYIVNYGMLLRYAGRRSKRDEIRIFINDKTEIDIAGKGGLHD